MEGGGAGGAEGEGGGLVGWGVGLWVGVLEWGVFVGLCWIGEEGGEVPWCVLLMFLCALAVLGGFWLLWWSVVRGIVDCFFSGVVLEFVKGWREGVERVGGSRKEASWKFRVLVR